MNNLLSFSSLDTAGDVNISFLLKFFRLARGTANELDDRILAQGLKFLTEDVSFYMKYCLFDQYQNWSVQRPLSVIGTL